MTQKRWQEKDYDVKKIFYVCCSDSDKSVARIGLVKTEHKCVCVCV
jgi:hypothetical protein